MLALHDGQTLATGASSRIGHENYTPRMKGSGHLKPSLISKARDGIRAFPPFRSSICAIPVLSPSFSSRLHHLDCLLFVFYPSSVVRFRENRPRILSQR